MRNRRIRWRDASCLGGCSFAGRLIQVNLASEIVAAG